MDVMKIEKVVYCVDFVTVHHFTKLSSHICNIGDFTEGGTLCPPPVLQGSKKPGINRVKHILHETQLLEREVFAMFSLTLFFDVT